MRKEKGLTLIALIVTIIVMIILAGIAISAITGKSGITNQARESKNKSERQEIIESAKSQISDTLVENVGTDITRSQLKEILDKYFENVPDDYTLDTELTTKSEYGNYVIKVSEIYDRTTIFADNGEDSSETTPANTSSTNGGSGSNSTGNNIGSTSLSTKNSESTGEEQNNSTREPEEIDVTGVKLDNKSVILDLNGKNTIQLNATPIPNNANKNTKMKWTSKKKTVATVTQGGMVTGKAVGNSTIMAASKNGKSAECLVVCQAKITGITVNPVTASIPVGGTIQLTATIAPNTVTEKITWKSSNTNVAKVDRNGLVTGVGKGRITITAQNPAGTIKATCTVTVGNATLMVASSGTGKDTANYLRSNVVKNKIESIKFVKGQVPTAGIIEQFDASEAEDSSIIGYYTDEDSNDMYELTFVSEKNIEANQNSSYLFYYLSNVKEIAFDNFDTSQVTNMRAMFNYCVSLTSLDLSNFDTSHVTDMSYMFGEGEALETLDVNKLNTNQVINMDGMFHHCKNLISLDVSKFDTSHVTDMSGMFNHCENLTSLDVSKFDTSQVKSMRWMFGNCESLTNLDVRKFDTSQVTNMKAMFQACRKLIELNISNFNTSQVTNMSYMFNRCGNLTSLDVRKFDTSQVTDMSYMFSEGEALETLDVSKFDTSQVTNMGAMFYNCSRLTSLDVSEFDTSQVTDMGHMFSNCNGLTNLDVSKFDTSQVTNMKAMFQACRKLIELNISNFNTSQVTNMSYMFCNCSSLRSIYVSEYNETTGNGWTTKNVTNSYNMFTGATKLVGGNGTVYNSSYIDATYARIDKEGDPGYLTKSVKGTTFDKDEKIFISGEAVTIPAGMTVSSFKGEFESIDQGIVIYRLNGDVPDWTNKTKMQETYDQFVWVPVKNAILDLSSTYSGLDDAGIKSKVQEQINVGKYPMAIKINTAGDYIGLLYEFSEVTENNTTYVKVIPNSKWRLKSTKFNYIEMYSKREPVGLTDSEYGDTETNLKQINGILNTSYNSTTSFKSALQSQYNEMVKKVEEKGGFWVGRYETSSMSNSTTENYIASNRIQVSSKRNTTNGINNVTWYKMYAQQKIYSELALESKITSSMIWGSQWDQIMIWMKEEKSSDQEPSRGKYYVTNGAGKGNCGTTIVEVAPTGSQDAYSTKNIFDLAGNVYEWSLEADSTSNRVARGGYFDDALASSTRPVNRSSNGPARSYSDIGSRLTLY